MVSFSDSDIEEADTIKVLMSNDLNSNSELAALAAEARAARERAARRDKRWTAGGVKPVKESVDPDEYVKRLNRSLLKDQVIVKEVNQARIESSLEGWKAKVGPTFANATTDNPKILDRVARLKTPTGRHNTSMILTGAMGAGKTWLGYAYINLALASGAVTNGQVIADTETSVLSKIASSGYKRVDMLDELCNPRYQIYFIDDVGQGYFSREDVRTEVWYELIDHVYSHQLTLIMTTNLPLTNNALGKWIGARAFDRLQSLVGSEGVMDPGKVNRRGGVSERREEAYRASHKQ